MGDQPPPPPPHGGQNGAPRSGGLPPGKYDIFVIPEHSAGSGFLYLPSLQPNINSFVAGFASALVLVALGQSMAPAFRTWWESFQGLGNMAIVMLIIGVGFGAWALGRTQKDGDAGFSSGFRPKPSASGGAGGFAGAHAGAAPHAGAPPPPPPHGEQGGAPHSGQNGGPPPHGTRQHDEGYYPTGNTPPPHQGARAPPPPKPDPKPEPKKEPPPKSAWEKARDQYKGSWEKAREETRKKEEERKAKEAEQKRKEETAKRLAELRAKEAKERQARETEKQKREKETKDKEDKAKAEQRAKELSEKMERERKAREEAKKQEEASKKAGSGYAFSGVGEKMSMWPDGKPPVPKHTSTPSAASSPGKKPPAPTAKTYMSEETHSYRPYDKPKSSRKKSVSSYAESDFSWAPSQTTNRTSPPPSMRGPYSTKDPDKIMISAVYLFMNQFSKTPASQLISGIGAVTDGLILRITTEGLFIDDDARGVPQREWDVKAWTLKQVETGEWKSKGLHILRATLRDQEAKRYLFIIDESEAWKMNLGLKRLKGGVQVRQLGVSGMTGSEARGTLEALGWDT